MKVHSIATLNDGSKDVHLQLATETRPQVKRDKLLRLPDVEALTGCKKSTIYNLMRAGKFVQPVRISARCTAWPESAVLQWVQDQITAARVQS